MHRKQYRVELKTQKKKQQPYQIQNKNFNIYSTFNFFCDCNESEMVTLK